VTVKVDNDAGLAWLDESVSLRLHAKKTRALGLLGSGFRCVLFEVELEARS
jgi:hypothetical protein